MRWHPPRRAAVPAQADDPSKEVIKELLTSIRAHSTLRFVALPFFLASLAILTKTFYEKTVPRLPVALAALVLSALACVIEIILSRNLIVWWKALAQIMPANSPWWVLTSHRHASALWWARWALFLSYPLTLVFWLDQLLFAFFCWLAPTWMRILSPTAACLAVSAGVLVLFTAHQVWRNATPCQQP